MVSRFARRTVAAEFDYDLNLMLMSMVLARLFQARLGRPEIRFALVGNDQLLASKAYHFLDFGLRPMGFFEGASDFMFEAKTLAELSSGEAELLIVSDPDAHREAQLLERLGERPETRAGDWKIVRLRRLVDAHRKAQAGLVPGAFATCLSPTKLAALACSTALSAGSGTVVEAGVFLGGATVYIAKLQRALGMKRRILAFDTFAGIPAPTEKDGDTPFTEGLFSNGTIEAVHQNYRAHGVREDITTVPGLVQETLPTMIAESSEIAFALLDLDQYAGTRAGLDAIVPRLQPRGIVAVDDADGAGVNAAIDETLAVHPELMRCNVSVGFDLVMRGDEPGVCSEV